MQSLQHLKSVIAAKIALDGGLVSGNSGFSRLLEANTDAGTRIDVRGHFLNPSFSELLAVQCDDAQPVFNGILNLDDKHGIGRSLVGKVHRDHQHLTVVAEYDVEEMERLNAQVIDLNAELADVQRNLARANRALQNRTGQLTVLAGGMLDMHETERRVLAYELHEELGQALAAVGNLDATSALSLVE